MTGSLLFGPLQQIRNVARINNFATEFNLAFGTIKLRGKDEEPFWAIENPRRSSGAQIFTEG